MSRVKADFYGERDALFRKLATHPDITATGFKIATMLLLRVNNTTRIAYPSLSRLATDSGEKKITVIRHLKALKKTGHLECWLAKPPKGPRPVNHYRFVLNPTPTSISPDTSPKAATSITTATSQGRVTGISPDTGTSISPDTPTSISRDTLTLKGNPKGEPIEGAALQAPAPTDGSVSGSTTPLAPHAPALRAPEGLRAGANVTVDPDVLLEIIVDAEFAAYENPSLMRPNYDPPPMEQEEAQRFLSRSMRSWWYRERAETLQRIARTAHPEVRKRADEARGVLLAHAMLVDHAVRAAGIGEAKSSSHSPRTARPLPSRVHEDEVPF
jgi:hypothetical protein